MPADKILRLLRTDHQMCRSVDKFKAHTSAGKPEVYQDFRFGQHLHVLSTYQKAFLNYWPENELHNLCRQQSWQLASAWSGDVVGVLKPMRV